MKKTLLLISLFFPLLLLGCSAPRLKCGQKIISVDTVCGGVIGCNYTYHLENGGIYVSRETPAMQNKNGQLCNY